MSPIASALRQAGTLSHRIGIDLGGTKIAGLLMDERGGTLAEQRIAAPRNSYDDTIRAIRDVVSALEAAAPDSTRAGKASGRRDDDASIGGTRGTASVGIGVPGSISPASGRMQNANSTWLNGRPLDADLTEALARPVRLANDANCFALSEATDGAGAGRPRVFGVIIGTGCGGGIVIDGRVLDGPRGIGGEWGHNPLPWAEANEAPGPLCWCGRRGCMETWVSGPALTADHAATAGAHLTGEAIAAAALNGDAGAQATLTRHAGRLARGLAHVVNLIDPDVIVLGGGLSQLGHLYDVLPRLMQPYVFCDHAAIDVRPPRWGDASGVRGAAWLWPDHAGPDTA